MDLVPDRGDAGDGRRRPAHRSRGDGGIARGEGDREREETRRREEWLGRLTGPEPVFDLVQPSWTKDLLVNLQKILNKIKILKIK